MSDWFGLLFFVALIFGVWLGLKVLAKPRKRTEEEFERNAAENTTMLGASLGALQGILDPTAAKAKEATMHVKEGRFNKKRREGKAGGTVSEEENYD